MSVAYDLIKEDKHALQFLHKNAGFDFEKPFFISKVNGSFTFNSVKKAIESNIKGDYTAFILLRASSDTPSYVRYYVTALILASVMETGFYARHGLIVI